MTERRTLTVDHFADGAEFRDYFKTFYGPTICGVPQHRGRRGPVAALDADIARVGDGFLAGLSTMEWEYLLLTARKG